jgi:hypothetical protein
MAGRSGAQTSARLVLSGRSGRPVRTLARPEQYGTRSETSTPVALLGHDVARVLERIADTLRPHCGRISESDLDRLATPNLPGQR